MTESNLSHFAYCTGPAQLVYLLSALEVGGVSLDNCIIQPFPGSARNDELKRNLIQVSEHLGLKVLDICPISKPSLKRILADRFLLKRVDQIAFWYSRGIPFDRNALAHLQENQHSCVFEYYDGYRSPIVARHLGKTRLCFRGARRFRRSIRQLTVKKLLEPNRYFMPEGSLWQHYASFRVQAITSYFSVDVVQRKIKLVGEILDNLNSQKSALTEAPGVVLTTTMYAERNHNIALADELRMYEDILRTVRSASRTVAMLTKTHPRSSTEKMRRLEVICAKYDAQLDTRQQLIEFILEKSGRRGVVVIGPPTTALLNTLSFGYGTPLCLSQQFMTSYLGDSYADGYLVPEDHELMAAAGVTPLNSLTQLTALLEEQKIE